MALKRLLMISLALALLAACRRDAAPAAGEAGEGPAPLSVTRWTEKTELFAEYPALVVGQTSRFAIHLTTLEPFKAVTEGAVEVQLRGADGQAETFRSDGPSRPGIFGVNVKPVRPGRRQLVITLRSPAMTDVHAVGGVDVHADAAAAEAAAAPGSETGAISFLKEQQWTLDFGTAVVLERRLRASIKVPAETAPAPGGQASVFAPFAGRLVSVAPLAAGAVVNAGQELARIQPAPGAPSDFPQLERSSVQASAALDLAIRDRERAERLVAAGAAPQKRLDEARAVEAQAQAALKAAQAQHAQFDASRAAEAGGGAGQFAIRAPIAGVIVTRDAAAGMNVVAGTPLFHVVNPSSIQVVGHVPENQVANARQTAAARIEVPGGAMVAAGAVVSIGRVLDPRSRTLPITFAADSRELGAAIGQSVFLHLLLTEAPPAPVVPAAAIVDDAGRPILFVQVAGESFERRPVTLGAREGGLVQVTAGVKTGERVVTKGAYLVRLASLSTSVPAHGHVH